MFKLKKKGAAAPEQTKKPFKLQWGIKGDEITHSTEGVFSLLVWSLFETLNKWKTAKDELNNLIWDFFGNDPDDFGDRLTNAGIKDGQFSFTYLPEAFKSADCADLAVVWEKFRAELEVDESESSLEDQLDEVLQDLLEKGGVLPWPADEKKTKAVVPPPVPKKGMTIVKSAPTKGQSEAKMALIADLPPLTAKEVDDMRVDVLNAEGSSKANKWRNDHTPGNANKKKKQLAAYHAFLKNNDMKPTVAVGKLINGIRYWANLTSGKSTEAESPDQKTKTAKKVVSTKVEQVRATRAANVLDVSLADIFRFMQEKPNSKPAIALLEASENVFLSQANVGVDSTFAAMETIAMIVEMAE